MTITGEACSKFIFCYTQQLVNQEILQHCLLKKWGLKADLDMVFMYLLTSTVSRVLCLIAPCFH